MASPLGIWINGWGGGILCLPREAKGDPYLDGSGESGEDESRDRKGDATLGEEQREKTEAVTETTNVQGDRALNEETTVLEPSLQRLRIYKTKVQSNLGTVNASFTFRNSRPVELAANPMDAMERDDKQLVMAANPMDAMESYDKQLAEVNPMDAMEDDNAPLELDESEDKEADDKATKSDDAEVKVQKWNVRLARKLGTPLTAKMEEAMDILRRCFLWRHK
jgi:hypothetical protein